MLKVISGGQTGADQAGLRAAKALGLPTGGWAEHDWMTEDGPQEELLRGFGLRAHPLQGYPARTKSNVDLGDATVWFGWDTTPGFACTQRAITKTSKPFWRNPKTAEELAFVIRESRIEILNVAGNRESSQPGIGRRVEEFLLEALRPFVL